ncbi:MAG: hypothetical protein LBI29_00835 [Rickettsiales bacterium]|jgi:lipopolysaccharide export system protein LptA|nr:hypothetical protein [Rickettsiales bacterium]
MKYVDHWLCELLFALFFLSTPFLLDSGCFSKELGLKDDIKIEADEIKIRKNEGLVLFRGNIRIKKGSLKMFVKKTLSVRYTNFDGKIRPNTMDMVDVEVINDRGVKISGDRGDYDFVNSILTIRDNVIVNEKNSVALVDRAVYDTLTEEINMFVNRSGKDDLRKKVVIIMDNLKELEGGKDVKKPSGD